MSIQSNLNVFVWSILQLTVTSRFSASILRSPSLFSNKCHSFMIDGLKGQAQWSPPQSHSSSHPQRAWKHYHWEAPLNHNKCKKNYLWPGVNCFCSFNLLLQLFFKHSCRECWLDYYQSFSEQQRQAQITLWSIHGLNHITVLCFTGFTGAYIGFMQYSMCCIVCAQQQHVVASGTFGVECNVCKFASPPISQVMYF